MEGSLLARVRPFKAIVFDHIPGEDISSKAAPPYDVIDKEHRQRLLDRDPHNVVALELPEGPLDPSVENNRYTTGGDRWTAWNTENVLTEDEPEAIYVLEQTFELEGRTIRRQAFVAAVGLEPFSAGVIIPHERTLPKALDDRLRLTRACRANLSQVFGMFSDPDRATDKIFQEARRQPPLLTATDHDGVESTVWAIRDPEIISTIQKIFEDHRIFIADGHHRYTISLTYRDERRRAMGEAHEDGAAYDSVMMALVNMEDPNLIVLPTHRIARISGHFDADAMIAALSEHFELLVPGSDPIASLRALSTPSFLVRLPADDHLLIATLRTDVDLDAEIPLAVSGDWKRLDVAILQELILSPLFDIHPDRPDTLERLSFVKSDEAALTTSEGDAVFIVNPTNMERLRAVALKGETMPQKSTYFYPKLLSGLLLKSLD